MPRPPGDPGYFDKVNYIIDSWARPCEAPWYIYIETLWPAALEAFLVLITFGWDDVLRGFWKPRGLGRRTGKRKGKWGRKIPRFPELGELIGSKIPGADQVKGRKWGAGGKTLWRIDTLLQKGLFLWLIVDVTLDLAYNWTSLLYETTWCQASAFGRFSYSSTGTFLKPANIWTLMGFGTKDYQEGTCFWLFTSGNSGDKPCTVTAATSYGHRLNEPLPTEIAIKIVHKDTGQIYAITESDEFIDADEPGIPASGTIPANTQFQVWSKHNEPAGAPNLGGVVVAFQTN